MTSSPSATSPRRTANGPLRFVAAAVMAFPLLAACGSSDSTSSSDQPAMVSMENLVIIDVRTPEEFSEQHLDGALNIDLQGPSFVDEISALDRGGNYAVYCRSGNRSAEAVAAMKTLGFTNVADFGSVAEASEALGVAVVS